jgi:hypothetical protein
MSSQEFGALDSIARQFERAAFNFDLRRPSARDREARKSLRGIAFEVLGRGYGHFAF